MATQVLASVKNLMMEVKKQAKAIDQLMSLIPTFMTLALMATAQNKKIQDENKRLKDENLKLAKQLADIDAVLASQVVIETEAEITVSVKKPRKATTARNPRATRTNKTLAVMEETATLLSVNLPKVSDEEADEEII